MDTPVDARVMGSSRHLPRSGAGAVAPPRVELHSFRKTMQSSGGNRARQSPCQAPLACQFEAGNGAYGITASTACSEKRESLSRKSQEILCWRSHSQFWRWTTCPLQQREILRCSAAAALY